MGGGHRGAVPTPADRTLTCSPGPSASTASRLLWPGRPGLWGLILPPEHSSRRACTLPTFSEGPSDRSPASAAAASSMRNYRRFLSLNARPRSRCTCLQMNGTIMSCPFPFLPPREGRTAAPHLGTGSGGGALCPAGQWERARTGFQIQGCLAPQHHAFSPRAPHTPVTATHTPGLPPGWTLRREGLGSHTCKAFGGSLTPLLQVGQGPVLGPQAEPPTTRGGSSSMAPPPLTPESLTPLPPGLVPPIPAP